MLHCTICFEPLNNAFGPCPYCAAKANASQAPSDNSADRSESFSGFASYDEPKPRTWNRKKIFGIAALVFFLILGREGGFLDWHLFRFNMDSRTQVNLSGSQYIQSGNQATFNEYTQNIDTTHHNKGWQQGGEFNWLGASPLVTDLRDEVERNLNKQTQIRASLQEISFTGLYWLPVLKTGNCRYRVHLQFVGKDSRSYSGLLNGETEFSFRGTISTRSLKENLGKEIAARVVTAVDQLIVK